MSAYFVTCTGYETDEDGNVTVVHATYDPETKSGSGFTGRKVKGTIHWVAADTAAKAEVRLYENIVDEEKGVYNEDGSINGAHGAADLIKEHHKCKSEFFDCFERVLYGTGTQRGKTRG